MTPNEVNKLIAFLTPLHERLDEALQRIDSLPGRKTKDLAAAVALVANVNNTLAEKCGKWQGALDAAPEEQAPRFRPATEGQKRYIAFITAMVAEAAQQASNHDLANDEWSVTEAGDFIERWSQQAQEAKERRDQERAARAPRRRTIDLEL